MIYKILITIFLIIEGSSFINSKNVKSNLQEQLTTDNHRDSRFLKFFNPISVKIENDEPVEDVKKVKCEDIGGTLVLGKCYEYFDKKMKFNEAKEFCAKRSGHLWIPRLDTPLFYNILMSRMPEISGAKDLDVWIGVKSDHHRRAYTLFGDDVTNAFLIQINDSGRDDELEKDECFQFYFGTGSLSTYSSHCHNHHDEFVCEYPIKVGVPDNYFSVNKYLYKLG